MERKYVVKHTTTEAGMKNECEVALVWEARSDFVQLYLLSRGHDVTFSHGT